MKKIRINLCGNPQVLADGREVSFPYKKAEGLLYYLCVRKSVTREELINLLWSEEDEAAGKKKLRDAIYQIRQALGKEFCVTTVISIGIASLCMSLVPVASKPIFDDYLTACLVGGLVSGTGAGLVLKGGTSGGGQDIIGVALSKTHPNFSVGKISIAINTVIYGVCFFLFDIQIVVYSMIFAVVNALALDYQHTQNRNVQVMIFTKKEGITDKVISEVRRGLTYWHGAGGYTDEDTYVLTTMVTKYELPRLIKIVNEVDPNAFVMVNEGTKIYGNFEKRFTE